jgi:hypothetical protein
MIQACIVVYLFFVYSLTEVQLGVLRREEESKLPDGIPSDNQVLGGLPLGLGREF